VSSAAETNQGLQDRFVQGNTGELEQVCQHPLPGMHISMNRTAPPVSAHRPPSPPAFAGGVHRYGRGPSRSLRRKKVTSAKQETGGERGYDEQTSTREDQTAYVGILSLTGKETLTSMAIRMRLEVVAMPLPAGNRDHLALTNCSV